ncbi:BRI3-binding protein [Callorhinchus milii]|uniref:Bri3 binding protein n=1 Tax=Callorhinchus milii TaxID=7868 RepID=A0A4W3H6F9_CALMI|nr:BRI3-binding protein [Callorhinchus milii]|eukprot:gi/632968164/ref/XP_007900380.1/ PREDICTED: BRI3-binding protein [Callorhinchus milii]
MAGLRCRALGLGLAVSVAAVLLLAAGPGLGLKQRYDSGSDHKQNTLRRAASGLYQSLAAAAGEANLRALHKFFSRITEQFVQGVDTLVDTVWKIWADLLDVLGIDATNLTQYLTPTTVANHPARVLLLVVAVLIGYWFLSMFLGLFFYALHALLGRFFWLARVALFALSCLYILQKFEGDPERAVLPLCFVVLVYFMTGPVGFYWRRGGGGGHLEEKIDHLEGQVRVMNLRLNRVLERLDRNNSQ